MIISASRRTDLPAFYSQWLMNRLRAGFAIKRNPYSGAESQVDLRPEAVDAIVFWTRNGKPLLPHLDELDAMGHRYYFQYTITGLPRALERSVPHPLKAIETFLTLAKRIGPDRMIWRFDPIAFTNLVDEAEHRRLFQKLAEALAGSTRRVVISFADDYKKTKKNLQAAEGVQTVTFLNDPGADTANKERAKRFACELADIAAGHGIALEMCAEDMDLTGTNVRNTRCIDPDLIAQLFGTAVSGRKDPGQRKACGCIKSVDLGEYNTCLHGCVYCYATDELAQAKARYAQHDPASPILIP